MLDFPKFDFPNMLRVDKESDVYERIFDSYSGAKVGFRKGHTELDDDDLWCDGFTDGVFDWCVENLSSSFFSLPNTEEDSEVLVVFLSSTDLVNFKLKWWP